MSSLRRREIVVSRARSPERSSTGGRVSARAAAAESSGSASTRSQAIASRTSGRWKSAAGPERWKGMPRSSIAAATAPPCLAGLVDEDADLLRRRSPPAIRCSTSRATACAWARSLAQRQKRELGLAEAVLEARPTSPSGWSSREPARPRGPGPSSSSSAQRPGSGSRRRAPRAAPAGPGSPPPARRPSGTRSARRSRRRTSGRSASSQSRARKTSPRSRLPAAARMRSWAA